MRGVALFTPLIYFPVWASPTICRRHRSPVWPQGRGEDGRHASVGAAAAFSAAGFCSQASLRRVRR
jgi:hypothetical protein